MEEEVDTSRSALTKTTLTPGMGWALIPASGAELIRVAYGLPTVNPKLPSNYPLYYVQYYEKTPAGRDPVPGSPPTRPGGIREIIYFPSYVVCRDSYSVSCPAN